MGIFCSKLEGIPQTQQKNVKASCISVAKNRDILEEVNNCACLYGPRETWQLCVRIRVWVGSVRSRRILASKNAFLLLLTTVGAGTRRRHVERVFMWNVAKGTCLTYGTCEWNVLELWKSVDSPRSLRAPRCWAWTLCQSAPTELMTLGLPPPQASPRTSSFVWQFVVWRSYEAANLARLAFECRCVLLYWNSPLLQGNMQTFMAHLIAHHGSVNPLYPRDPKMGFWWGKFK